MELLLRVEPQPDLGMPVDLVVEVDADDRVDTLVCLLMRALHLDPSVCVSQLVISIARTGIALAPESMIADVSIMSGDSVVLEVLNQKSTPLRLRQRAVPQKPVAAIDILSGSDAGALVPLVPGQYLIGSGDNCAIRIADAKVLTHHLIVRVEANGRLMLADAGDNGITFVDGAPLGEPRQVDLDDLVMIGDTAFKFQPGNYERERDRFGMIPHNRTPYHPVVVIERKFESLVAAPRKPDRQRFRLTLIIAPIMMGGFGYIIYHRVAMMAFSVVGLFAAVYGFFDDKRYGKGKFKKDTAAWRERLAKRASETHEALEAELSERLRSTPDVSECANRAHYRQPRLWERDTTHSDFLRVRLGVGEVASLVKGEISKGGEDDLFEEGKEALEFQSRIQGAPVSIGMREFGVVGIEGDIDRAESMACALLIQAATLHSPEELIIAGAFQHGTAFDWLKWLPHTRSVTSPLDGLHLTVGPENGRSLLSRLGDVIATRLASRKTNGSNEAPAKPHVLLVLHEASGIDPVVLAQFLDVAPRGGVSVLWIGFSQSALPRQCTATLSVGAGGRQGVVRFVDPKKLTMTLSVETSTHESALAVARALAPVREVSAGSAASSIPRSIELFSNLGLHAPSPTHLLARWSLAPIASLHAPIGQSADGSFSLDLVEQGPHALIAGTSGAGKSELLQTLVAGLAATYAPNQLNFLFVDYKGGAAVQDFMPLPHAVGFVTDLDSRLALRALASLRSELKRREHLLEGRAKDIVELERLFPGDAPPRLVIVIDEFATLVKEIPDFVAGIVDVAQRGRSLGIHLILATQRPAGAVSDNILANTNLRIALRVLDPGDSMSVLGSPEAASIPAPLRGRAFARTGARELTAFQTAYSGAEFHAQTVGKSLGFAPFDLGSESAIVPIAIEQLSGSSESIRPKSPETDEATNVVSVTQLQALVSLAGAAANMVGQSEQRKPWLEPLPPVLNLYDCVADSGVATKDPARVVVLGRRDLPKDQAQPAFVVDFETDAGLLIFGSGGSGKTTTLLSLANSLSLTAAPSDVWVYAIDCAGRRLAPIDELPIVGAVVFGDELERITRVISLLTYEVEKRARLLADAGLASLGEYNVAATDEERIPRIVLMIDNWQALNTSFENLRLGMSSKRGSDWIDDIKRLVVDGRPAGVHVVITAPTESMFPGVLTGAIGKQLRFRSSGDTFALGKKDALADMRPGQGLAADVEVQIAILGHDPSGAGQGRALSELAKLRNAAFTNRGGAVVSPPKIAILPRDVDIETVLTSTDSSPDSETFDSFDVPIGVRDKNLGIASINLTHSHMLVSGIRRSGKSSALLAIAQSVWSCVGGGTHTCEIWGIGNEEFATNDVFDRALSLDDDVNSALTNRVSDGRQLFVFVDDADQLDKASQDALEEHAKRARPGGVRLVVAFDTATLRSAYGRPTWITELIRAGQGFLLGSDNGDAPLLGSQQAWADIRPGATFGPGRGLLVRDARLEVVQLARPI